MQHHQHITFNGYNNSQSRVSLILDNNLYSKEDIHFSCWILWWVLVFFYVYNDDGHIAQRTSMNVWYHLHNVIVINPFKNLIVVSFIIYIIQWIETTAMNWFLPKLFWWPTHAGTCCSRCNNPISSCSNYAFSQNKISCHHNKILFVLSILKMSYHPYNRLCYAFLVIFPCVVAM